MASGNIRGITIELGGDTTGLEQALGRVNTESKSLQSELKAVERGLKFDPGNVELVRQRQELLTQSISDTSKRLDILRTAQAQVQRQYDAGEIPIEQYRAFQRELQSTETQLRRYETQLSSVDTEQSNLASNQRQLQTYLDATGQSVDDLANTLGTRLTNAIRDGSASSDQLDQALNRIGRRTASTGQELEEFRSTLRSVDDGNSLDAVRQDLDRVGQAAQETSQEVEGLADGLKNTALGASVAIGGLGLAAVLAAGDVSNSTGQIQAALGATREEAEALQQTAENVFRQGFGESLEEVSEATIRVSQNIKNIDPSQIEQATISSLALAEAFDSDVNEVTRAANNLIVNFGVTSEKAFDLLANGAQRGLNFSGELFDNVAEYSGLFSELGFTTEQYFNLLEKGSQAGVYNLDYLNDLVKEFGIRIKDGSDASTDALARLFAPDNIEEFTEALFAGGKATKEYNELVSKTSAETASELVKNLQKGGKSAEDAAVALQIILGDYTEFTGGLADGTITGAQAFDTIIEKISAVEDPVERTGLGVDLFGTKFEDLGETAVFALGGLESEIEGLEGSLQSVTDAQGKTFGQQWESFTRSAALALAPIGKVLLELANVIFPLLINVFKTFSKAFEGLPKNVQLFILGIAGLIAVIGPIIALVGTFATGFALLSPAIAAAGGATAIFGAALAVLTGPITLIIGSLVAFGAALVALYSSNEEFANIVKSTFSSIRDLVVSVFTTIGDFIGERINQILTFWNTEGAQILQAAQNIFNGILAVINFVMPAIQLIISIAWTAIQNIISGALNVISGLVQVFSGIFTGDFSKIWDGIVNIFKGAIELVLGLMTFTFFGGIRSAIANITKTMTNLFKTGWTNIVAAFKTGFTNVTTSISGFAKSIYNAFVSIKNSIVSVVKSIDLRQIGVDIIRGLANGIAGARKFIIDAVKATVGNIVEFAKDLLGIRSPSRVFMEIGKFTGQGLAIGIDGTRTLNEKSINSLLDVVKTSTVNSAKELAEFTRQSEKEKAEVVKKYADQRAKAEKTYADSTTKAAVSNAKKSAKAIEAANKAASAKQVKAASKKSEALKKIDADEKAALKKINDDYAKERAKKLKELEDQELANVRNFIKKKVDANQVSLIEEAEYYRASYQLAVNGSKANLELQKDYQNAVQRINDSITTVNEDFVDRAKKINDDLIKNELDLNKKYEDALNSRYNALVSSYGLFDEVTRSEELVDPQVLVDNLNAQVNALQRFSNSVSTLQIRGISGQLLEDLQDLGPKANEQLEALNRLTDSELLAYQQTYENRARLAREVAVRELEPLREDTENQIKALRSAADTELNQLNVEWQAQIKKVVGGTEQQLQSLQQVGKNAGQRLLDGLTSTQGALLNKSREIAESISRTINDALNIGGTSNLSLNTNIPNSSQNLKNAVNNAQASLNSSAVQSNNNQTARALTAQSNSVDVASLVSAIGDLASRPIQTAVQLNGQTIATSTSQYQNSNYNVAALQKGVTR